MYEHIAKAIWHFCDCGKNPPYQADAVIKKIEAKERNIKLLAANVRNPRKEGITKQGTTSWSIRTDHVKEGEFTTLEDIKSGYGHAGDLLHVPKNPGKIDYWEAKRNLEEMASKVFALFQGHYLCENDIAQVMGYWDGDEKGFCVCPLSPRKT